MLVLKNGYFGSASVEGASPRVRSVLAALSASEERFTVRMGRRTYAQQAEIFTWGRTVMNPDAERSGIMGPNGLGQIATWTMDSLHLPRRDGCFYALDLECKASALGELHRIMEAFGMENPLPTKDPDHWEDPDGRGLEVATGEIVAAAAAGGTAVMLIAAVVVAAYVLAK